jgi:hypothetical protein
MREKLVKGYAGKTKQGSVIFHLDGGAKYASGAHFDGNGIGALRMTAIDAKQICAAILPSHHHRDDDFAASRCEDGVSLFVNRNMRSQKRKRIPAVVARLL